MKLPHRGQVRPGLYLLCLGLLQLSACGAPAGRERGRTSADPDPLGADPDLPQLVAELERSGVNADSFAHALAQTADELAVLSLLPARIHQKLEAFHEAIADDAASDLGDGIARRIEALGSSAGGKAAVVIIASGESGWKRNLLEWFALSYFNVNVGRHYDETAICTGDEASWDCFRGSLAGFVASEAIGAIDLYSQAHGGSDGPSAYDNAGNGATPADLLSQASKLRYGMFMNCFAASSDTGFPQTFVARGGRAAYGARGVSTPTSDFAFQMFFGTLGYSFSEAVSTANSHPANWFAEAWSKKKELGEITVKEAFGVLEAWIGD